MGKEIWTKEKLEEQFSDHVSQTLGLAWIKVEGQSIMDIEAIRNWARQLGWYAFFNRSGSCLYFSRISDMKSDWSPVRNWTKEEADRALAKAVIEGNYSLALNVDHSDDANITDICRWAVQCGWKVTDASGDFIHVIYEVRE